MRTINCLLIDVSTAELQFSADVIPSLGYQMTYNRTIRKTRRRNAGEKREIFVSNKNKWEKRRKKKMGGRWNYDLRRRHTHTHGAQWNRTDFIQMVEIRKEKKKNLLNTFLQFHKQLKGNGTNAGEKRCVSSVVRNGSEKTAVHAGRLNFPSSWPDFYFSPPFVLPFFSFSVSFFLHFLSLFFSPSLLRILLSNERYHSRPIPQT